MDYLFNWPDLRRGGGRAVFIVGSVAHSLDTESGIESSMLHPGQTTSGLYSMGEIQYEFNRIQQVVSKYAVAIRNF